MGNLGSRREYVQMVLKWLEGPRLHIFDQKFPSVIGVRGENLKIIHYEPIFQPI